MGFPDFDIGYSDGSTTGSGSSSGYTIDTTGANQSSIGGTRAPDGSNTPFEKIIRGFDEPDFSPARAAREAREADTSDESLIRWGKPANFNKEELGGGGFSINNSAPKKKPPEDQGSKVVEYNEINRETFVKRVTGNNDPNDWVDIEVIKSVLMQGPEGREVRFNYKSQ